MSANTNMISSVYIPRVGKNITDILISVEFLNNYWADCVYRVDFVPIGKTWLHGREHRG